MLTGFFNAKGVVELDPTEILRHYAKGWLSFDLCTVASDWLASIFEAGSAMRMARMWKFVRILRLMRLMRLIKVPNILGAITGHLTGIIDVAGLGIYQGIAKILVAFIFYLHFVSCAWYAVGDSSDPDANWVKTHDVGVHAAPFHDRYLQSFHWAMSNFAGETDVTPTNSWERLFSIAALVLSFVMSAVALSLLTSSMAREQCL